jgi:hypothetical protein
VCPVWLLDYSIVEVISELYAQGDHLAAFHATELAQIETSDHHGVLKAHGNATIGTYTALWGAASAQRDDYYAIID